MSLKTLLQLAKKLPPIPAAIVCPESPVALTGTIMAAKQKSIIPTLIGDPTKIKKVAQAINQDISAYQLIAATTDASSIAAKLAYNNQVELIVKGSLHTDDFMRALVKTIRTKNRMSHCQILSVPTYKKLLILTDAALNTFPTFIEKQAIVQNAITLAKKLGIPKPKVALLSAVETINPHIPNTIECKKLCKSLAKDGIIVGPISLDLAVSEQAVKIKNFSAPVAGNADILVVPNIEVGNVLLKALDCLAKASSLGYVAGAKVPIVLTSRATTAEIRADSCMLAKFIHKSPKLSLQQN